MSGNVSIQERTFEFGVRVVSLVGELPRNNIGYAIGNQIMRSRTSIGANIMEAQDAMSRADFIKCMNISLKEARETEYWLKLIVKSNVLPASKVKCMLEEIEEIVKILRASLKKLKLKK